MWFWLAAVAVAVSFAAGLQIATRRVRADATPTSPSIELDHPAVQDVLEALHLGIAISGRDGVGEFRNSAAQTMAGTHAGVLLDEAIARHLARGLVGIRSDEEIELHGPPRMTFIVRSSPLPDGGSASFVEDISERRRTDQIRTDFVANVSHELKTPIGALSVLAETLQGETDSATIERLVGRMVDEAQRASQTIDDLTELSLIELGGDSRVECVPVADVVSGGVDRVREIATQRGIAISTIDNCNDTDGNGDVAPNSSLGLVVRGNRRQLVSAVGNLIENAVKYSESGDSVEVRTSRDDETLEIRVIDQGVGIPARHLGRVFERFYRVDEARSRATGGTGLGLSIVRNVATGHGGDVDVNSTEGEGSTFILRLPLATSSDGVSCDAPGVRDGEGGS